MADELAGIVYAVTFPHYLRHPVLPPRTLVKVGSTTLPSALHRHGNRTLHPEPLAVLREWPTSDCHGSEGAMHSLLDRLRFRHPDMGYEWFLVTVADLDAAADFAGLVPSVQGSPEHFVAAADRTVAVHARSIQAKWLI